MVIQYLRKIIMYLAFLSLILVVVACSNESSTHSPLSTQTNLDDWIGQYEYFYSTNPDGPEQKVIMYELSIEYKDEEYYAFFTMEGWLTYHKAKAKVQGNSSEITIIYDSYLDGPIKDQFEQGDILFKIKRNESNFETEAISPLLHDLNFQPISSSDK